MWSITFTSSFLESLSNLPKGITKKFPEVMKALETDPTPHNGHSIKLKDHHLWRIPISRQYRLFYQYGNDWVKLIEISLRNEGTYKGYRLDKLEEEDIPDTTLPPWFIDEVKIEPHYQFQRIKEQELRRYDIPQIYWQELINIGKEKDEEIYQDNLIEYISTHISEAEEQDKIFDCLVTKPFENLEHQSGYIPKEGKAQEFIDDYLSGQKNHSDLVLQLSEEQKKVLTIPLQQPILVKGGAGTGKTILAIHKVAELAHHNKQLGNGKKILFTTYTTSLANYIKELLIPLLKTEKLTQDYGIDVYALDDLATKYYQSKHSYTPSKIDREKSFLLLYEAYIEVSLKNNIREEIKLCGGTSFLLEEFIYYIEARGIKKGKQYQQLRKKKLSKELTNAIWIIYENWLDKVNFSGYITADNLRSKANEIVTSQDFTPPYDVLVIDEAQDLSPVALKFLSQLLSNLTQVFITADINQSLYQRSCGWNHIEASFNQYQLYRKTLTKSFRNTRQIGKGCLSILPTHELGGDNEMVSVFSESEGDTPTIILTDNDRFQIAKINQFYQQNKQKFGLPVSAGVVLTPNLNYSQIIATKFKANNINAEYIKPEQISNKNKFIQVLDIQSIKGLEFPFVVIVGLNEGLFPHYARDLLEDEKQEIIKQQRKLFYVGCSRAIYSLLVIGRRSNPSTFLDSLIKDTQYWKMEKV